MTFLLSAARFLGIRGGIAVALALALGLMTLSRNHEHRRAQDWQRVAALWKDAHAKLEKSYAAAQAVARAKAEQQIRDTENKYVMAAWRADNAQAENDDLRRRAADYARASRVRPQAAGSAPGGPAATAQDGAAQGGDGPGADAVVLARADFDTLIDNTLRLSRVKAWADDLIARELAAPADDMRNEP